MNFNSKGNADMQTMWVRFGPKVFPCKPQCVGRLPDKLQDLPQRRLPPAEAEAKGTSSGDECLLHLQERGEIMLRSRSLYRDGARIHMPHLQRVVGQNWKCRKCPAGFIVFGSAPRPELAALKSLLSYPAFFNSRRSNAHCLLLIAARKCEGV